MVDNVGDQVIEAPGGGTDTVRTTLASYALGDDVENLFHTGAGAFHGTGNALDNAITDFDAKADRIHLWFAISGVSAAVHGGSLSPGTFDQDLASVINADHLGAHQAGLFTPTAGGLAGNTFLIVDANGQSGYQAGEDLVVDLHHPLQIASFGAADFV